MVVRLRTRGFSLVEVTLAIGIIAFAFVAIFGLLPAGLTSFRRAMDYSIGTQIVSRLTNEAIQTDYSELIKITPEAPMLRYFDDQGNEVKDDKDYLYSAEVSVVAPTELPNSITPATPSLATVTIKLANNPSHRVGPFASGSGVPFDTFTAMIAKNQ